MAEERKDFRKSALTKLRKVGDIPAVVYGKHEASKSIAVKGVDLLKIIGEHGRNGIISLKVKGKTQDVILEDYQADPINHKILHADFLQVNMSSEIHAKVHVELLGTSKGIEHGGILQQSLHELNITAKPKDIPEEIEVDITDLDVGHTINIAAIRNKYSHIVMKHDDDEVIASVIPSGFVEEDSKSEELA